MPRRGGSGWNSLPAHPVTLFLLEVFQDGEKGEKQDEGRGEDRRHLPFDASGDESRHHLSTQFSEAANW